MSAPRHIVVMGVTATGKTTVGRALAEALGGVFVEGDTFHPPANIAKMSAGIPLDDDDRRPWLRSLATEIARLDGAGEISVTACSALRRVYRDWLREGHPGLFFVHLDSTFDVLLARMKLRTHFMPPSLLQSQLDTLEPLEPDEAGVVIDDTPPADVVIATSLDAVRAA
ncbi:gluconokinase [Promicromonospora iranensis]|uniref:gluconokinase n=1 Tax=Promicromonospora iranensis TaxID=1105144 RepID=UPI0023A9FDE0|nr:gluconokinase [Promicromonospora iranensis]